MNNVLSGLRARVSSRTSFIAIVGAILASSIAVPLAVNVASATFGDNHGKVDNITGTIDASFKTSSVCKTEQSSTGLAKDQLAKDLWHFVVQSQSFTYDRGERNRRGELITYRGTLSANFTEGGYAELLYSGNNTATQLNYDPSASNNQKDHLYVFTPPGTKITGAWLTYKVDFTAASTDNNKTTPSGVPTYLTSNHVLSHTCPAVNTSPTIVINTATPSYDVTYDQTFRWTIDKSLFTDVNNNSQVDAGESAKELYYDSGERPIFTVTATRQAIVDDDKSNWTVTSGTQKIKGTFTITNAARTDVTISSGTATCTTADDNPGDLTFEYTCTFPEATLTGENGAGLSGNPYSVSGSITKNSTTYDSVSPKTGKWGSPNSEVAVTSYNESASLEDDLAGFDGDTIECRGCGTKDTENEANDWGIRDGVLVVEPRENTFSVKYEMAWDWAKHKDDFEWVDGDGNVVTPDTEDPEGEGLKKVYCQVDFKNTVTLSIYENLGDESAVSEPEGTYTSTPSCPPPAVTLDSIDSSYDLDYTEIFDWTIEKTMVQNDDYKAAYTVTATRTGPKYDEFVVSNAQVSGTYTTEFADPSQVEVTVRHGGHTYGCTEGPKNGSSSDGEFTCHIVDDPETSSTDETPSASSTSGLDGQDFFVEAVVDTAGGRASDDTTFDPEAENLESTEAWGEPEKVDSEKIREYAGIVDDLAGKYGATDVTCELVGDDDDGEICGTNTVEGVLAQDSAVPLNLTTNDYAQSFELTYLLDWSYLSDSTSCPTIVNTAWLASGNEPLLDDDDEPIEDESSESMDCPEPTITLGTLTSNYTESWVDTWQWSIDKASAGTYEKGTKPTYTVTATKGEHEPSGYQIDDDTQWVQGSFTIKYDDVDGYTTPANGSLTNAVTTVDLLELTDLYDETSCVIDDLVDDDATNGLTYTFTCTVADESTVIDEDGLSTQDFEVEGSVDIYGNDADKKSKGSWREQSEDSGARGDEEKNTTASLVDNLAGKGGEVIRCEFLDDSEGSCDATIDDDPEVLKAGPYGSSFEVTYTIDWDWRIATAGWTSTDSTPDGKCAEGVTNTAVLLDKDNNPLADSDSGDEDLDNNSVELTTSTQCPPPKVDITSVTSTYDMEYGEIYPWTIEKKFVGQDENWNPMYEVTATRGESFESSGRVKDGHGTVYGTFTTEFANYSEVEVEVDYNDETYTDCVETDDTVGKVFRYSCTVPLSSSNLVKGVSGDEFTVRANVITPGGESSDTSDETNEDPITKEVEVIAKEWGQPNVKTPTKMWEDVVIIDDLGGYGGTVTSCLGEDAEEVCSASIDDIDPSEEGVEWQLRSVSTAGDPSATEIFVSYTLNWDYSAEDACTTAIYNKAKVMSDEDDPTVAPGTTFTEEGGEKTRDQATTSVTTGPDSEEELGLKCPEIEITVDSSASYSLEYDQEYTWSLDKSWVSTVANGSTYDITYKVDATRSGPYPSSGDRLSSSSPSVSGTFTMTNASLDAVDVSIDIADATCTASDDSNTTDTTYKFSCSLPSMSLSDLVGDVTVTVSAEENWDQSELSDTATWGWTSRTPASTTNASATIEDDLANLGRGSVVTSNANGASTSSGKLTTSSTSGSFSVTYKITGVAACRQTTNTAVLTSSGGTQTDSVDATTPCPPVAGLTIGYWGNKMGGTEVISKKATWRNSWPTLNEMKIPKTVTTTTTTIDPRTKKATTKTSTNVVYVYPVDWLNDSDVRQFMTLASCSVSNECKTMLLAQGLASAMNVLRDPRFGEQKVWFGADCVKVNKLLEDAFVTTGSMTTWSTAKRTAYKTIFDDLNNTRAKAC